MKTLLLVALSILLATPAMACEGHAKKANGKAKRKVASVATLSGEAAKAVYLGLPGAPDKAGAGSFSKEGILVCYRRAAAYDCSVRGEDEETGKVEDPLAKQIFEKLNKANEYDESNYAKARETNVKCVEKSGKTHSCTFEN